MSDTINLPEGYIEHDGGPCPVDPEQYVDMIIRTGEGLGHSGVLKARYHVWEHDAHDGGLGAVVGYRIAIRGQQVNIYERWPEEL